MLGRVWLSHSTGIGFKIQCFSVLNFCVLSELRVRERRKERRQQPSLVCSKGICFISTVNLITFRFKGLG